MYLISALHLACCAGDEESVTALLKFGAKADAWDDARVATPLHCAACSGSPHCISELLDTGVDLNLGVEGKTPLYYAVQVNSLDSVRQLLEAGANPNNSQVYTETPLHVAAAFGFSDCLKLLLENGADVRVQFGPSKATALHLAAQDGNADCARLLLDAGADTGATNNRMQTPLHLAALAQSTDTLELLLQRKADPNAVDADLRTPLHCAIVKESRSCECVRMLLVNGANFNCADAFGYTPLHLAALHEFSGCVAMLINAGADVMARTNGGVSALTFVVRRTPDTLPCFIERFDASVTARDHDIGDADCEIRMDFRSLLPPLPPLAKKTEGLYDRRGESAMLLGFIEVGMRQMLKHPLCETFLFLKWRRIRKFFLISLAFHLIFVAHYTAYIVGVFFRLPILNETHCWNATEEVKFSDKFRVEFGVTIVGYLLMALNLGLMAKEIFQVAHGFVIYANHWENWLQWLIILSVFGTYGLGHYSICNITNFQHHVAAVGIVFTWTDLMVLIGRFPTFGVYVQMFTTVSINFSKFLFAYFCLLVGFGLGLGVLFPHYPSLKEPHISVLKSVIMMSGELEFEDIFFNEKITPMKFGGTSHVMFLAFVILVTVILTNLLVGLAVSDIQGLQKTARLNRLVRQAELISHLESILFSRILIKVVPIGLLKPCLRSALLVSSAPYNSSIYLRPNDPREKRLPRYLLEAAYNLVVSRSGRKRRYNQDTFRGSSRRSAYKSWAMQCSFSQRSTSVDREESEIIVQQNQMMTFISSQLTTLVAEAEARDCVLEDLVKKLASVEKSLRQLQNTKENHHD
ncbi:hypothetical protein J437_LFUL007180 [Ladona fulva]|uniref:Ion transport domain-containing protein n=1 Tax=Ladona fulva TaxID=123851 RepID=A0A8K0K7S1_LADFU|nr:hypothetical protein J437_LFUL007180 [Ladona fulva]